MKLKIYQIDAFTDRIFSGNPAAVCPLEEWLSDNTLQSLALENNLAETAFYVKHEDYYEIRWFTPTIEVDLCGHATLATAFVLFHHEHHKGDRIRFQSSRSGLLTVTMEADLLTLNFPADTFREIELTNELRSCFDVVPTLACKGRTDYLLVFANEEEVRMLKPALSKISELEGRGVIVTAKGKDVDFVSRFFAPQSGIDEDPVTGSAHTTLTPYWAGVLNKKELTAMQLSQRGGHLRCHLRGERVEISGQCKLFMKGEIFLD